MNIKITVSILFLCLSVLTIQSQTDEHCDFTIEGRVFDRLTEEPLSFVSIQISGTSVGTNSDDNGYFLLENICEKEYDLVFSRIGYKDFQHHHDFHHPEMKIYLVEEQYNLEGITVEAKKSESDLESVNSTKLTGEDLKTVKSQSLGDIASQFTGVSTLTTGQNISKPIIHGLHSNRVLVVNNGIRHEFQNWGIDHAAEIDPSLSNEIEVVKGAGTVRFGPDALGGVILVSPSKLELSSPLKGNISLLGKSNGRSGETSVGLEKGFKWLSLAANAAYTKQGDLHAANYQLTNTGKEDKSYSARFRIHPSSEVDIEGYYSHVEQDIGILLGSTFGNLEDVERALMSDVPLLTDSFSYEIRQPRQEVSHDLFKLNGKYIGKNQSFDFQYGYQINKRKEFGLRRGDAPNIDLELRTHSLDLNWFHPHIGPITGKIGIQGLIQANDNNPGTNTVPFIPNYDQKRLGVYLIETFEWKENLLEFGVRYDYLNSFIVGREPDNTIYRNDLTFQNFSSTIGFKTHLFNHDHTFRSNFGTAWRAPNVAELYRFGQHSFFLEYGLWRYTIDDRFDFVVTTEGILDETDRPVDPEVGYKWINTYEVKKDHFRAEIAGYVNYVENFISTTPGGVTRTPRGVFIYYITDQSNALFWGIDATTEWEHNDWLSSQLKGSYLWAKQISNDDFFVEQPPANLQYQLAFQPKVKGLSSLKILGSVNYTFEQFQHPRILSFDDFINAFQLDIDRFTGNAKDFDILAPPKGYLLANLSVSTSWKQLDFQFGVTNLFNSSYRSYTDRLRYFADGLGRNFQVGVTYQF